MFDGEVSGAMREDAARITVEPSYVNVENPRFGRLARFTTSKTRPTLSSCSSPTKSWSY